MVNKNLKMSSTTSQHSSGKASENSNAVSLPTREPNIMKYRPECGTTETLHTIDKKKKKHFGILSYDPFANLPVSAKAQPMYNL